MCLRSVGGLEQNLSLSVHLWLGEAPGCPKAELPRARCHMDDIIAPCKSTRTPCSALHASTRILHSNMNCGKRGELIGVRGVSCGEAAVLEACWDGVEEAR
jgi:hypothetical protein